MPSVTIYHNPSCGTSRTALAILRERGIEPEIVEYMKDPLNREQWDALIEKSGLGPREFLRNKEKLYDELDLGNPKWSNDELIGFLVEHPRLLNRPIVATPKGIRPCRPAESVRELLD